MEKSIILVLEDLKIEIADLINKSQVNPYLIKPIIKELYDEISVVSSQQLQQERIKYEEEQRNKDKEEKE